MLADSEWQRLIQFRDWLARSGGDILAGLLRALPPRLLVATLENLAVTAKVDYDRNDIFLRVDSLFEYTNRLNACRKEPETIKWIETFIQPGDVVFDIGANVGAYSLIIDKFTQGAAKVYAFEPVFSTFSQLNKNIFLNHSQNHVIPLHIALSGTGGLVNFNYRSLSPGTALHALGKAVDNKGHEFTPVVEQPVVSCCLDDLIDFLKLEKPNHIKLDVDGGEEAVLRGADLTLSDPVVRSILIELEPGLETSEKIIAYLEAKGFAVHSAHRHGPGELDTHNYIFIR